MNSKLLEKQFHRIGARARIHIESTRSRSDNVSIDIGEDRRGEYFDISLPRNRSAEVSVVDTQPGLRHLLLMSNRNDTKHKFLCGHDERHWFVAAVPERAAASTVSTAFKALMPLAVRTELDRQKVKPKNRNRRRNKAFIRQGEWFFVPLDENVFVDEKRILLKEPIARGGGKPHLCEELVRQGGEAVYVSSQYPQGLRENVYHKVLSQNSKARNWHWVAQIRNPQVLVRGTVRHRDHKTIHLEGWHQVLMNTETESEAMRHVMFID